MPRPGHFGLKHSRLLDDDDRRRCHAKVARGSRITADIYLRQLDNFCLKMKVEPKAPPAHVYMVKSHFPGLGPSIEEMERERARPATATRARSPRA